MNQKNLFKEKTLNFGNIHTDRFIKQPAREYLYHIKDFEQKKILKRKSKQKNLNHSLRKQAIQNQIGYKILHYLIKQKTIQSLLNRKSSSDSIFEPIKQIERKISQNAFKILDAPGYKDDFFSSLLDWNLQNQITLCVNNEIFIHNYDTKKTFKLHTEETILTSLKSNNAHKIAFGTSHGSLMLYDQSSENCYKYQQFHDGKITSLDFIQNYVVVTGSSDKRMCLFDLRTGQVEKKYSTHKNIVCKVSVNKQDSFKILSGGKDKKIVLYDLRSCQVIEKQKAHQSSIRALDWDYNTRFDFYSGGNMDDNVLKKWNSLNFQVKDQKIFDSQICDLVYNPYHKEIILGLGQYQNQIAIVKANNFQQIANLQGHKKRVLDIRISNDCQNLVSASNDGSIRFWQLDTQKFQSKKTDNFQNKFKEEFLRQFYQISTKLKHLQFFQL